MIRIKVGSERLNKIDDRIFGHFLERASFGEPGPEPVADPETGELPAEVVAMLREMRIPVVRFPGGTDIDYIDWHDLVSNVPGRETDRPVTVGSKGDRITNRFGIDEYFRLRDQVGFQTILVTNLLDGVGKKRPLREVALLAAGLVAYANAPLGARLPDGMPDWPAVRAKNGHPEPYASEYFQIGNEWYGFITKAMAASGLTTREEAARWYREVLIAYIDAMRAVDPSIKIIIDGHCSADDETGDSRGAIEAYVERRLLGDPEIRRRIDYAAIHEYAPGAMGSVSQNGSLVSHSKMSAEDWWYTWIAMPGQYSPGGESVGLGERARFVRSVGIPIACTEWNWNGWRYDEINPQPKVGHELAAGIGAAGFLHGLMRDGEAVSLGCQSMLLGSNWGITAIRIDPAGERPPHYLAQGHATMFYSNHHGSHRLATKTEGIPTIRQPYQLNATPPREAVALLDVVTTADESTLYVHAINRDLNNALDVEIDLSEVPALAVGSTASAAVNSAPATTARHHVYTGDPASTNPSYQHQVTHITSQELRLDGQVLRVSLPAHSVNVVEVPTRSTSPLAPLPRPKR